MKKNKTAFIFLGLAILSAIVSAIVGMIYYTSVYGFNFIGIALAFRNVFTCFAFTPALSIQEIVNWEITHQSAGIFQGYMHMIMMSLIYMYAGIILVAPICTATALYLFVVKTFRQFKWKIIPLFWKKPIEKILVIGNGEAATSLINREKNLSNNREIYYIANTEKSIDEEVNMLKRKIRYHQLNLIDCTDKDILELVRKIDIGSMNAIIICEDSDSMNFSIYIRLMQLAYEKLSKDCLICCKCEDNSMMNLIANYYDDNRLTCLPPKIFSIAKMRSDAMLEKQPLPVIYKGNASYLVVGFSLTGQNMVKNMINMGVTNSHSSITIHVVDTEMDKLKSMFLRYFSDSALHIENDHCYIDSDELDGKIEIIFHKMDVRGMEFKNLLDNTHLNYIAVCIKNEDYCLDCMHTLGEYIARHDRKHFPIVLSILSDPEITDYLNQNKKRYINVLFVGLKTFYSIDHILLASLEENARKFHSIYQSISLVTLEEYQNMLENGEDQHDTPWEDLLFYKQESSRQLSKHQPIKEKLLKHYMEEHNTYSLDKFFGENGSILQKKDKYYVFDYDMKTLTEKLNADPFLREMGMLEHRRWSYYMITQGWSYGPVKIERKKETPYLVTWDRLCEEHPEVCIYDYMTLLIPHEGA